MFLKKIFCMLCVLIGFVVELYAQAEISWLHEFDTGGQIQEAFYDIYSYSEGGFLACGIGYSNGLVMRLNADGEQIWEYTLANTMFASVIEADGGDAVAGGSIAIGRGVKVVRLSGDGEEVWRNDYGEGHCSAVIEMKNNDFMLAGWAGFDGTLTRITGEGDCVWSNQYRTGGNEYHKLYAMRETDGGVVVVGSYTPDGQPRMGWIIKVGFDGDLIWSRRYEGGSRREFASLVSNPEGGFVVAGTLNQNQIWEPSDPKFNLVKIGDDGAVRTDIVYDLVEGRGDVLYGLNKLSDGYVLVGSTSQQGYTYPLVLRVGRQLNTIWSEFYSDLIEGRPAGQQPNTPTAFRAVVSISPNRIVSCGGIMSEMEEEGQNSFIMKLEPDILGPQVFYFSPEDTVFSTLIGEHIDFIVRARTREGNELRYQWGTNDRELGNDTLQAVDFDSIGVYDIFCHLSDDDAEIRLTWHVTVADLYISAFTPDTLNLTLRRGSSVDFSIDTVRYVEGEPPEYLWTVTNLDNNEQSHPGVEAGATITFNQSGNYTVVGLAYRGESSDAVTWNVTVRGAIWAFAPVELAFEVLPDSLVSFAVEPTVPDDEGQMIQWIVDGEVVAEDTTLLQWSFGSVDNFPRYLAQVQVVVADTVEADTVSWEVTVREPDAVGDKRDAYPTRMELLSVSPNPFNSMLSIRYDVGARHAVPLQIAIYDISGRIVAEIASPTDVFARNEETKQSVGGFAKTSSVVWDASSIPAGVYFVCLQSGREVATKKVVLVR